MARGQVFTLATGTSRIIETETGDEMDSVAVLNPNDGVVYLKLNGPAGPSSSQWDWKLPSQSYGLFPGPWVSLGLYYQDQSGSSRNGELNVYSATNKLYTPQIAAIGRAVQVAGTTMDITQGAPPQNPPASTARLWADANRELWVTLSNGSTYKLVDSNDALGGVLTGTVANAQYSTGPQDMPAMLRSTGLGNYNSGSGAGLEFFYSGGIGYIQCLDRSGGGSVPKQFIIQACGPLNLSPTGNLNLNATQHIYVQPNGSAFLYRPNLQTPFVTNSNHFDSMYVDDWLRPIGNGMGMFNSFHNQGVGINAAGGYDYATGRQLAKVPVPMSDLNLTAGDIANLWFWHLAPAGSTASGTDSLAPYGTLTCTGYTGGRFIMMFDFELTLSGTPTTGSGVYISLYLNGGDANMRYLETPGNIVSGSPFQVHGTYMYNASTYSALSLQFYWHLLSGGQINVNTGVYSKFWVVELKK